MEAGPRPDGRLQAELCAARVAVLKLQTRQEQMLQQVADFQEESRRQSEDAHRHGWQELDALRRGLAAHGPSHRNRGAQEERLPSEFFRHALAKLEARLQGVSGDILEFRQLLDASFRAAEGQSGAQMGLYGQRVRIGAPQLVAVIQRQNEAFLRIAQSVAELHAHVEEVRRVYLDLDFARGQPDPFEQVLALTLNLPPCVSPVCRVYPNPNSHCVSSIP